MEKLDLTNANFLDEGFGSSKKAKGLNEMITYISVKPKVSRPMDYVPTALSGDRLEDEVFNTHENSYYEIPKSYDVNEYPRISTGVGYYQDEFRNFNGEDEKGDKIIGIPKTGFWIGVGAIALIAGIVIYKKYY